MTKFPFFFGSPLVRGPEQLTARLLSVDFVDKYLMHEENAWKYFFV